MFTPSQVSYATTPSSKKEKYQKKKHNTKQENSLGGLDPAINQKYLHPTFCCRFALFCTLSLGVIAKKENARYEVASLLRDTLPKESARPIILGVGVLGVKGCSRFEHAKMTGPHLPRRRAFTLSTVRLRRGSRFGRKRIINARKRGQFWGLLTIRSRRN